MRVYSLSIHADYKCRHSGACCTAGWPIPVERASFERLRDRFPGGRFIAAAGAPPDTPAITNTCGDGACAFYERDSGLCAIHRHAGPPLMPAACRVFPRVSLRDDRGLFVNLSHYCPTAAGQLFREDRSLAIVEGPGAFPAKFDYDPFDARGALPPLLRPGVLLDLDTFGRWEREVVAIFAQEDRTAEEALHVATDFTEALRGWSPQRGSLGHYFAEAFESTVLKYCSAPPAVQFQVARDFSPAHHYRLVLDAIPDALRPLVPLGAVDEAYRAWVEPRWPMFAAPARRYLASKAFGSWLAYQGYGLRTIVFSLVVALSVLKANASLQSAKRSEPLDGDSFTAAVRRTDELVMHLASPERLAGAFGQGEARPPAADS